MPSARTSCGTRGMPSDTRPLVSCQQHVKDLTPRDTRKLWTSVLGIGITFAAFVDAVFAEQLALRRASRHSFLMSMSSRNCIESQTSGWLRPFQGSNPHVAYAMRVQWSVSLACKKFHLALKMLLSNALWQPVTTLPT